MFFFGHIGITFGVIKACDSLLSPASPVRKAGSAPGLKNADIVNERAPGFYQRFGEYGRRLNAFDYRLVIFGSLLPDIIDKPLFMIIRDATISGRGYAHTLVFSLILLIGGLALTGRAKSWMLVIALSSLMHLVLDSMWRAPVTLFWPFLGPLLTGDRDAFLSNVFSRLVTPEVFIPEIIGLIIIAIFAYKIFKGKTVTRFVREGTLD